MALHNRPAEALVFDVRERLRGIKAALGVQHNFPSIEPSTTRLSGYHLSHSNLSSNSRREYRLIGLNLYLRGGLSLSAPQQAFFGAVGPLRVRNAMGLLSAHFRKGIFSLDFKAFDGGRTRARTLDPLIKSQLLYQLSYAPIEFAGRRPVAGM